MAKLMTTDSVRGTTDDVPPAVEDANVQHANTSGLFGSWSGGSNPSSEEKRETGQRTPVYVHNGIELFLVPIS